MNNIHNNSNNNNGQNGQQWNFSRFLMFVKRRLKLNRFLLVIDTKKGVSISAATVIVVDLIDLLWNLSMTFGPLNPTMTTLLLIETFLVVAISSVLLYAMKTENKADLRSILFTWLVVVAIDYCLRAILNSSALVISEKASTTAKVMRSIESIILLVLVAHCWLCVLTYYDDNNGKITTVKITPSDDKGRSQFNKRQMLMMKQANSPHQAAISASSSSSAAAAAAVAELSASSLERGGGGGAGNEALGLGSTVAANMLRAPTEDVVKSRW